MQAVALAENRARYILADAAEALERERRRLMNPMTTRRLATGDESAELLNIGQTIALKTCS